ncbi:hypothetical protein [Flavobacterium sp.]|uniref:hypothetical protein n=1 Tax=Flavobacterium sp. TaxID=239 RepID=UPI00286E21D3|nr:hypothetical protein [Flavobacterium sp.]
MSQNLTTAKIINVTKDGLHTIVLPTQIRSISKEDLSDFRILDSKGNEVPYFYNNTNESTTTSNYVEYKIISETAIPKKQTTIIFENPEKSISSLLLSIANYDGEKTYNLSGSNDQKQWYGLSNNNVLSELNAAEDLNITKTISFPLNNYKFLKIELDDKKSLPISIQRIGNDNSQTKFGDLLLVDYADKEMIDLKSEKKTKIHILFDSKQFLNQIRFKITEPKLYKRTVRVFKLETRKIKHKFETFENEISNFELSSDSQNNFNLFNIHEKDFYIEIENQDNQPLKISEIKFFQVPISVIADLKTNENYTIKTGNSDTIAPNYDLENFKNSITVALPEAKISEIAIPKLGAKIIQEKPLWEQPWFMWVCISIGGIAVLYFSMSLIKDLNKNNI